MDEPQSPRKVSGDGRNADRHVFIRLLPNGVTDLSCIETVIVNSDQLKKCSKYFEACFSQGWTNPNSPAPFVEFNLEMIHGLHDTTYIDCFSRMDSPLRKDFRDVKYCLELLRVACQIEFDKLICSICKYLSIILWSDEDELMIRQYASSPDFRCSQAQGLLARLELGESQAKTRNQSSALMQQCIKTALRYRTRCRPRCNQCSPGNFSSARSLLEELLGSIGQSGSSDFDTNMVMLVSIEARAMLVNFHEECIRGKAYDRDQKQFKDVYQVPGFTQKLSAVNWILKVLVREKVADEVVECFLLLKMYPKILASAADPRNPLSINYIDLLWEFVWLIVVIHREVVAGNVVVGIPARAALLEGWKLLQLFSGPIWQVGILAWGYARAVEDVFSTLPFSLQMSLVVRRRFDYEDLISPCALARLVKRKCAGAEEVRRSWRVKRSWSTVMQPCS